jgi:hypothetical protein
MTDWQERYAKRDWAWLDDWWRRFDDREGAALLLERLRADVPRLDRRNGMEMQNDYVTPREAEEKWKGAAEILYLGELEAWVEGEPISVPDQWEHERARIEALLREFAGAREVTKGDPSLSRRTHAHEALESLASIDFCTSAMSKEIDADGQHPADREWLISFSREIAFLAFNAGSHARAAIGKKAEAHAVRGEKVHSAARSGGESRRQQTKPEADRTLQRMRELIDKGHTQKRAAELAYADGYGTSADANRKLLNRHRTK